MTPRMAIILATTGSASLLAGAFLFQWLGWAPCKMCLWQRWPHAVAVAIGVLAYFTTQTKWLSGLGALTALVAAGLGVYHSGVELKWWLGPSSCTSSGGLDGLAGAALLPSATNGPALVLCDTLTPFFMELTMANYNALFSIGLIALWAIALRKS